MNPRRYHNEFVCRPQLANDHDLTSIDGTPADQVFPLSGCLITLSLYDFSSENRPLYVERGQCIFVKFIQGMERDDVPAFTDSRSETFKDSRVQPA